MSKAALMIIVLLPGIFVSGTAQPVEIYGYYEPQYMGVILNYEYSQLFSNKLRVDLQSTEIENVTFAANFDYITYHGRTDWNLLDFFPDDISDQVPSTSKTSYDFSYDDTISLDNAYLKIAVSKFDLTLGKQQISSGAGYAWNPTDLFNTKNIADPTYEQSGHSAARLDIAFTSRYSATAIYFPENNWYDTGKLLKLGGKFSHFDYSLIFIEKLWQLTDYTSLENNSTKRRLYGGDIVGELFGLGVWSEFGYNTLENHHDFWEILFGLDYTLDNGTYLMAEYFHNELAKSDHHDYNLNDWLRYFAAESRTISRDNLYLYCDYPLTDLIHCGGSAIISVSDGSFGMVPTVSYNIFQNVEMNLFAGFNFGSEGKALSADQGSSGILRLRIYF